MKKKPVGAIVVLVICLGVIGSISLYYKKDNKNTISLEEAQKTKSIAFYIKQDDGSYIESNSYPTTGYKLNEEKSVCSNGAKPKLHTSDNSLDIVNLNGNTNCYLYFDENVVKIGDVKIPVKG